jgi:transposase
LFGAVSLADAEFTYYFAEVFNGMTFWAFLQYLVRKYRDRKVFVIIDNAPSHRLPPAGKRWLTNHSDRIELYRLPSYSPEFNPMEPIWKATRKRATHNRFYTSARERESALRKTFAGFQRHPSRISAHVRRFQDSPSS